MWERLILPALLIVTVPASAAEQISDRHLVERVAEIIRTYPRYTIFDSVEVGVESDVVTLSGRVTTPAKKDEIVERVKKIDGVGAVVNDIGVLPVSQADNDLRYRVARAIYNHPVFWTYAQMPVPPIHIVVERGRITLTGVADTEVHRSLASSLAQVSGSLGVTNRIQIDERARSETPRMRRGF
jgi:osmotically-inducible protein OsmY